MVSGIKDRLGENLAIGDLCVCYNSMRTGSSTTRLVQYEGEIIKFTNKFIKVKCVNCFYSRYIGKEFNWCLATSESKEVCIDDIFSVLKEMNGIYV